MPKRGLLLMLPMRARVAYPAYDDEIITLPEITLPPGVGPGGIEPTPGESPVDIPSVGFDFPVIDIVGTLPTNPANTPSPSNHLKDSLTFHWEGDASSLPNTDDDTIAWLQGIAAQHIAKDWGGGARGNGIMYHEAITRNGTSLLLRDYTDVVWHSGNSVGNLTSRGILVVCSLNVMPTPQQINAVRKRTVDFGVPVFSHRDWSATQCPGAVLTGLVNDLRAHGYGS